MLCPDFSTPLPLCPSQCSVAVQLCSQLLAVTVHDLPQHRPLPVASVREKLIPHGWGCVADALERLARLLENKVGIYWKGFQ